MMMIITIYLKETEGKRAQEEPPSFCRNVAILSSGTHKSTGNHNKNIRYLIDLKCNNKCRAMNGTNGQTALRAK